MSEQESANAEADKPESTAPVADWLLQNLVSLVNSNYEADLQLGVVLQVRGTPVSGLLIHGRRYFEGFAAQFASGWPAGEAADAIRESYAQFGRIYTDGGENDVKTPPSFVHLKNAKLLVGDKLVPANAEGVWWRGRLSEVDGFSLGTLSSGD